jgi:hypothetical protein
MVVLVQLRQRTALLSTDQQLLKPEAGGSTSEATPFSSLTYGQVPHFAFR